MRASLKWGNSGFTLLELLVVMTLMSLVLLATSSAMRSIAQVEGRVDLRLFKADEQRIAVDFLRSTLGRVTLRKGTIPGQAGQPAVQFSGGPDTLMWVGIMPGRHGVGGRYWFRLASETINQGSANGLVIRFVKWSPTAGMPDWATAEARVLVAGVSNLAFEYEDARKAQGLWLPDWAVRDGVAPAERLEKLPARIRLHVSTPEIPWPPIVIPLRVVPSTTPGGEMFTIGGVNA